MLKTCIVKVTERALSADGRFPVREYAPAPKGYTKFIYCIRYITPLKRTENAESENNTNE